MFHIEKNYFKEKEEKEKEKKRIFVLKKIKEIEMNIFNRLSEILFNLFIRFNRCFFDPFDKYFLSLQIKHFHCGF